MFQMFVGRYYLVDCGYALEPSYMAPYRSTRYHLEKFRDVRFDTLSDEEKFNLVHSSLRNVIEWAFGVLKSRWHILGGRPFCDRDYQVQLIVACFALHNYLWEWEHGMEVTSGYALSEWVQLHADITMSAMRHWIKHGLCWDIYTRYVVLSYVLSICEVGNVVGVSVSKVGALMWDCRGEGTSTENGG